MAGALGRLERVGLRDVWSSESGNFTPWLAQEGNLALLGEAIGLDLELEAQEKNVGPFRADILCKDTLNGNWVLVENQLERTDHSHLGQLMTYAAGLDAVTIVWIAESFAEEHRAALDWLNEITDDQINFFGLQIELWRIGDSPVAPRFNVISKPNNWTKTVAEVRRAVSTGELTETRHLQQEYWAGLMDLLRQRNSPVKPTKPLPQSWVNFSIGRSYMNLTATLHTRDNWINAQFTVTGPDAKAFFGLLKHQKEQIEQQVESLLIWDEQPNRAERRIQIMLRDTDPTDRFDWPRQHRWLAEQLEALYRVFAPRVKGLNAAQYVEDQGREEVVA